MSREIQHLQYRNVLRNLLANGISEPILVTDTKTIKAVASFLSSADMELAVYGSFNPSYGPVPNLAAPVTADNEYHQLSVTEESTGVSYGPGVPFNPSTAGGDGAYAFNIETTGENWVVFAIENRVAGELDFLHSDLYSNFN